jgi:hypothetical protein
VGTDYRDEVTGFVTTAPALTRYEQGRGIDPSERELVGERPSNWSSEAPHSVVDYVVVHELCHLIHPNHSRDFWALVGRHDPAYSEHRQWLKERGEGLL